MGYDTEFIGVLKFNKELSGSQLSILNEILGEDFRDFSPEVKFELTGKRDVSYTFFDLKITDDFSGIEWDGSEKFYDAVEKINIIIKWMRIKAPNCHDFGLTGSLFARGEDIDDMWNLVMVDGVAKKVVKAPTGKKICCPHCEEEFYYED